VSFGGRSAWSGSADDRDGGYDTKMAQERHRVYYATAAA